MGRRGFPIPPCARIFWGRLGPWEWTPVLSCCDLLFPGLWDAMVRSTHHRFGIGRVFLGCSSSLQGSSVGRGRAGASLGTRVERGGRRGEREGASGEGGANENKPWGREKGRRE